MTAPFKRTAVAAATQVVDAAVKAANIFHNNCDTLVAGFLIRHPDVHPGDVDLVFTPLPNGALRFGLEVKELHVPPALAEGDPGTQDLGATYRDGWNACRQAMIDTTKAARPPEADVQPLDFDALFAPEDPVIEVPPGTDRG